MKIYLKILLLVFFFESLAFRTLSKRSLGKYKKNHSKKQRERNLYVVPNSRNLKSQKSHFKKTSVDKAVIKKLKNKKKAKSFKVSRR